MAQFDRFAGPPFHAANPKRGRTIVAPHATRARTWNAGARELGADLFLATALVWTLPVALGVVAAAIKYIARWF